jgi:hypothetical protein
VKGIGDGLVGSPFRHECEDFDFARSEGGERVTTAVDKFANNLLVNHCSACHDAGHRIVQLSEGWHPVFQ